MGPVFSYFAMSDRSSIRRAGLMPTVATRPLKQAMIEAEHSHDAHCSQYFWFHSAGMKSTLGLCPNFVKAKSYVVMCRYPSVDVLIR